MQLSGVMTGAAERTHQLSVITIKNPDHVVGAVGDQYIFLLWVGRKREVINCATRWIGHAPDSSAVRATRLRRWVNPKLFHEFPLLGEDLNPVAAALADVNETIA